MLYIFASYLIINYSMNSHLYIFGNDNMLITVNGIFLGNAGSPITFVTEENALLYFSVLPFDHNFKPFAFSLKVNSDMTLPSELGVIVNLPAHRYEIRLNAPKYPEMLPPPVPKIIKTITVKAGSPKNSIVITDEGAFENSIINNQKSEQILVPKNTLPSVIKMQDQKKDFNIINDSEPSKPSAVILSDEKLPKNQPLYKNESSTGSTLTLNPPKSPKKTTTQKNYKVSLVEDVGTRMCIECGKDIFYHILPQGINNINLKAEILNNELVACVTAEDDEEKYKMKYLLLIKGTPDKYQIMIEGFVDKITQEGKKITTLKLKGDIACRGLITVYDGQTFEKTEEYYVYCKGEPVHTLDNRLMPIAVFEAVKCKDFNEAKYYLTDSLNEILTPEKLEDFFEDYYEIIFNNYYSQYPHSFLLIDKNNNAALINTVYKNNKIDNFVEIEF